MAITAYGVDQSITEPKWALLFQIHGRGAWQEVVMPSGGQLAPSVGTGTRLIQVADGNAVACGVLLQSSAQVGVTLDANNGSNDRIDYIVAEIDWAGTSTTGGSIKFVKGTNAASPVPPSLSVNRAAGTKWQIPLAKVTVHPGVGQIAGGDLEDVRPLPREPKVYRVSVANGESTPGAGSGKQIASIAVPDPGWQYRLQISGVQGFQILSNVNSGRGEISALVDDVVVTQGQAGRGNLAPAVLRTEVTATRNGNAVVKFRMTPDSISGEPLVTNGDGANGYTVMVIPS